MQLRIETVFENKIKQDEEHGFPIIVGKVVCGLSLICYDEPLSGTLKIILEGDLMNQICLQSENMIVTKSNGQQLLSEAQEDSISAAEHGSTLRTSSIPFYFTLPDQILPPYNSRMLTFDIPPSICISHWGNVGTDPVLYGHCYVSYRIRSQVMIDGRVVNETVQPFRLYMDSNLPPPVCPEDFPRDYHLSDGKVLSSFFHFKRGLQMTIEAREPEPIVMTKSPPSTTIHLHLKLSRVHHSHSSSTLGTMLGRLTISLQSETAFFVRPCSQVPTSSEANSSLEMVKTSNTHLQDTREITIAEWTPQMTCNDELQWECDTRLLMNCRKMGLPPPTFVTPWVCRKYLIHLGISLRKYPRQDFQLRIPVQVIY